MQLESCYSWGERRLYGRGQEAALPEGATAGARGRAPGHYSPASGGDTEGREWRRDRMSRLTGDQQCRDRRGDRKSHGRGREQGAKKQ